MKFILSLFSLLLLGSLGAQTFEWNAKSPTVAAPHPKEVQTDATTYQPVAYQGRQNGLAGVYNPNANGMVTAYGETYNANEMTASHALYPLGTLARVVNFDNGRSALVRINDRGQECQGCMIMLSQAAADYLGVTYRSQVSVERTGFSNWNPLPPTAPTSPAAAAPSYNNAPAAYSSTSPSSYGQVVRPGVVTPTTQAPPPSASNYTSLSSPSSYGNTAITREVQPRSVEPETYSRYPVVARPGASQQNYQPQPYQQTSPAPQPYQQQQASPITTPSYQPPVAVPQPYPSGGAATVTVNPPSPTVSTYEQARGVATPTPASRPVTMGNSSADYAVQLAAYNNETYAQRRVNELTAQGIPGVYYRSVTKPDGQIINRVYSGSYPSVGDAQNAARDIQGRFNIAGIVARM